MNETPLKNNRIRPALSLTIDPKIKIELDEHLKNYYNGLVKPSHFVERAIIEKIRFDKFTKEK